MAHPVGVKLTDDRKKYGTTEMVQFFTNDVGVKDPYEGINSLPIEKLKILAKNIDFARGAFRQYTYIFNLSTTQQLDSSRFEHMLTRYESDAISLFCVDNEDEVSSVRYPKILDVKSVNETSLSKFRMIINYGGNATEVLYTYDGINSKAINTLSEKQLELLFQHSDNATLFFKGEELDPEEVQKYSLDALKQRLKTRVKRIDDSFSK